MTVEDIAVRQKTEAILAKHQNAEGLLVSILQDIQGEYNHLPRAALLVVSRGLDVPLTQVYGVATFFKAFSLQPRGRHLIQVCLGTACHVRGASRVLDTIERELGITTGRTTEDLRFSLERVNCVGACALGPIVVVDGEYAGEMTTEKVSPLLNRYD